MRHNESVSNAFKLVVVSDLHPDVHTLGVSRFLEVEKAFTQAKNHAIKNEVDAFLFLGDLADPDSGSDTFKAIAMLLGATYELADAGIKVILVAGNHDVNEDGGGATTLTPIKAIAQKRGLGEYIFVAEEPSAFYVQQGIVIMCLPFTPTSRGVDLEAFLKREWPTNEKVIIASHLSVPGIIPGEETTEMPRGREIGYPFAATSKAVARFQGHYHRKQVFDPQDGGPPIIVPGSLARLTFGEKDHAPSFIEVDIPLW